MSPKIDPRTFRLLNERVEFFGPGSIRYLVKSIDTNTGRITLERVTPSTAWHGMMDVMHWIDKQQPGDTKTRNLFISLEQHLKTNPQYLQTPVGEEVVDQQWITFNDVYKYLLPPKQDEAAA